MITDQKFEPGSGSKAKEGTGQVPLAMMMKMALRRDPKSVTFKIPSSRLHSRK